MKVANHWSSERWEEGGLDNSEAKIRTLGGEIGEKYSAERPDGRLGRDPPSAGRKGSCLDFILGALWPNLKVLSSEIWPE